MSEQQITDPAAEALEELEAAAEEYRRARDAVDEYGREQLEDLRQALDRARTLLATFEDKATDTGAREFLNFAKFKGGFSNHVEELDDDLPARDAFEAAFDAVDKRRLNEDDFERARAALEPAESLVERLDDLDAARDRLRNARQAAKRRRGELEDAVAEREQLLELGDADLDAPVEELQEPIDRWNDAVEAAFADLRTDASARETFALLERAEQYPLVALPSPPEELREYVETSSVGEESVTRILKYADFSRSKLDHYVDDADRFRRVVGTRRSALEALSAEPLTVDWPPPSADVVPWRVRALRGIGSGLVDDDAVAALRDLERAARDEAQYERLRAAALARSELTEADRRRLQDGEVEAELEAHEAAIDRLDERLEAVPDP